MGLGETRGTGSGTGGGTLGDALDEEARRRQEAVPLVTSGHEALYEPVVD
jgi:hypothetical protein